MPEIITVVAGDGTILTITGVGEIHTTAGATHTTTAMAGEIILQVLAMDGAGIHLAA